MFLVKNNKSPNFQIVYFRDGKRTTVSTKTSNKEKAEEFLFSFRQYKFAQDLEARNKSEEKETKPKEKKVKGKKKRTKAKGNKSKKKKNKAKVTKTKTKKEKIKSKETTIETVTLKKFWELYQIYVKPLKSMAYIKHINQSLRQFYAFTGNIPLSQIDVRKVDQFISLTFARTKRGSLMYFRTLKAAFSKAVSWGYMEENPFKKIKFPRIPKSIPVFITIEEFKVILSYTEEKFLIDIFTTAFHTGMRLGELVNMQWDWIDPTFSTITTKNSDSYNTKSKKERIIPINTTLKPILISHKLNSSSDNYVFTRIKNIKLNEDYVSRKFKIARRAAGLNEKIHFHTLRHSFASVLVQKGASLFVVKELLGHEDIKTTLVYSHIRSENLRDAVNLI